MTKKASIHAVGDEGVVLPITVGNPLAAADLAIDQSHMEDFAMAEEGPAEVTCAKPPKGVYFAVIPETSKPWQNRRFYFMLEVKDRDPFLVAPAIAKQKSTRQMNRNAIIGGFALAGPRVVCGRAARNRPKGSMP